MGIPRVIMGRLSRTIVLTAGFCVFGAVSWSQQVDLAGPPTIGRCEQATFAITVTNTHLTQAMSQILVANTRPNAGSPYVLGSATLSLHDGTILTDDPAPSGLDLVWNVDTLLGFPYELPPGEELTVEFDLATGCGTLSRTDTVRVDFLLDGTPYWVSDSQGVEILPGAVRIEKLPSVVSARVGDEVTWTIVVESTGLGPIYGVVVTDVLGSGLAYVSSSPPGMNIGQTTTWEIAEILPGDKVEIEITARVIACAGLENKADVRFGCAGGPVCFDTALQGGTATASIQLIVESPLLEFTPPSILIPYCDPDGTTVTMPITNNGVGPATEVRICVNFPATLQVENVQGGATWDGTCFRLPDLDPGETFDLVYDLVFTGDWCAGGPSGGLYYQPVYENVCGDEFRPPTVFGSYGTNYGPGGPPSLLASLTGPGEVLICTEYDYGLAVSFSGLDACGGGSQSDISVLVAVPDGFVVTNDGGGTWTPGPGGTGGTIAWTIPPTSPLNTTLTLRSPGSAQCGQVTALAVTATATDCCSCPLSSTGSVPIAIECRDLVGTVRTASPTVQEKCGTITYTNAYTFADDAALDEVSFDELTFIEYANNLPAYVAGTLAITVDGAWADPIAVVDTTPGGTLAIQGIDDTGSVRGHTLVVSYQLAFTQDSQPTSCPGSSSFYSWSELQMGPDCQTGDECAAYCAKSETIRVTATTPSMSVSVTGLPDMFVDPCGTYNVTVTLTKTSSFDPHDVRLRLENPNYYIVDLGSIQCNGDVAPASCMPTDFGAYYEWEYGTAFVDQPNGARSVLTFQARKRCNPQVDLTATATFEDSCGFSSCSVSGSDAPSLMRQPLLYLYKTPEVIYATQNEVTWTIYVINGGAGPAYEVWVDDTLDSGLEYVSSSTDPGVTTYPNEDHTGAPINGGSWHIPVIAPGGTKTITLTARLVSCQGLTEQAQAMVFCEAWPCAVSAVRTSSVLIPTTNVVATAVTNSPINTCSTQAATITVRNAGDPAVYDLEAEVALPFGLGYVPGSTLWRKSGGAWNVGADPVIVGFTLTWTKDEAGGLAELRSRQTIEVQFQIGAECAFSGGALPFQVSYTNVCGAPGTTPVGTFNLLARQPQIGVTKTQISPPSGSPIDCGGEVTWRIQVTNTGPIPVPYVWIEDEMAFGFTYVSSTGGVDGGCNAGLVTTWVVENLPLGGVATLTLIAGSPAAGEMFCTDLSNTVRAYWGCGDDPDGDSCTDDSTCLTGVPVSATTQGTRTPTVSLSSSLDPGQIEACGETTFTLTITNTSTATAAAIDARVTLPTGLSYVVGSTETDCGLGFATGSDPQISGQILRWYNELDPTWNLCPEIPPGGTVRLRFGVKASCYVTAQNALIRVWYYDCCETTQRQANASLPISPLTPTLTITKLPATEPLDCHDVNSTVTWQITVRNTGSGIADWVRIEDTLGTSLVYVDSNPTATSMGGQTWGWEFGPLEPSESRVFELTVRLDRPPDDCGSSLRTNTARAWWGCGTLDGDPTTPEACTGGGSVTSTARGLVPDLAISSSDVSVVCNGDDTFAFQAEVRNLGDAVAADTAIRVFVDGGLAHETLQNIPVGGVYTLQFTSSPLKCGEAHTFRIVVDEDDRLCECNEGNNAQETLASCPCPALVTEKAITEVLRQGTPVAPGSPIQPGDLITYTLSVRNVGLGRAFNVDVRDELPVEFEYSAGSTSAVWPGGNSNADPVGTPGPNLMWSLSAELGHNETLVLSFQAEATSLIREGQIYTNTMWATGEEGDGTPIPADNSSQVPEDDDPDDSSSVSHPTAVPALSVNKTIIDTLRSGASRGPAGPVEPGDVIVYEFRIRNVGNGIAYNVDLTDELPFGVEYDTTLGDGTHTVDSPAAGPLSLVVPDGATGTILADTSATIAGGGALIAIYRVRVTSAVSQGVDLVNYAVTTGEDGAGTPIPEFNPDVEDTYPDWDSTQIGVVEPGLALEKEIIDVLRGGVSIWPTPIVLWGDVIVYRVTVHNVGLGTAYNVNLTDELPFGLAYDTGYGDGTFEVDDPPAAGSLGIPHGAIGYVAAALSAQVNGGGTLVAVYRGLVTPEAIPGSYLTNLAAVTGEDGAGTPILEFNPDVDDTYPDRDSTTIRVGAPALVTDKEVFCDACPCALEPAPCEPCAEEPVEVAVGERVTFRLIVTNVGYSRAYDVVVEDRLPLGFVYIAETSLVVWPSGQSDADPIGAPAPVLLWITGASLDAGETLTVIFDALATSEAPLGEEIRNTSLASAVDDFAQPIPADSRMFVPEDNDLDDTTTLRLLVRPAPGGRVPPSGGGPASTAARAVGGWASLGVAALVAGLAFRLRWPRGKASRRLWLGLLLALALTGLGFMAAGAEHSIMALSDPLKGGVLFGAGIYETGETVQLTALPNRGFEFVGWFEDGAELPTSPLLEFVAARDRTIIAEFRPILELAALGGLWQGTLDLLPATALGQIRFELRPRFLFGTAPWDLRLVTAFTGTDWKDAQGHFTGSWEKIRFGAGLLFNPLVPEYRSGYVMASWTWEDLRLGVRVTHYPRSGMLPAPYLLYSLSLSTSHLSVTVRAEERDGIKFKDLTASLFGLDLCCGIETHGTLSFTKEGFSYVRASVADLPLWCCDLSLDIAVTFTPDKKTVDVSPRWSLSCDACLTVYGDVLWDKDTFTWEGLALYGYKIRCCFGGCCPGQGGSYVEFLTAFDPSRVPGGFRGDEFEYIKVGACGLGCCGGSYSVEAAVYFVPSGSLFGISRLVIGFATPLSGALLAEGTLEVDAAGGAVKLGVGWKWKF